MNRLLMVFVLCVVCLPAGADFLDEAIPDEASSALMVDKNLDGSVRAVGSWEAFQLTKTWFAWTDFWDIDPVGAGASVGVKEKRTRFGLGWHDGPVAYVRIVMW